jgi:hypothetical protein
MLFVCGYSALNKKGGYKKKLVSRCDARGKRYEPNSTPMILCRAETRAAFKITKASSMLECEVMPLTIRFVNVSVISWHEGSINNGLKQSESRGHTVSTICPVKILDLIQYARDVLLA